MVERSSDDGRSAARTAIMEATYRALCERGYAALTMQDIAEEYGKSTAAIHYYYDTKDDLLAAFLEYLLDRFIEHVRDVDPSDPSERLSLLLDRLLTEREDDVAFMVAMLEMRAQAPYRTVVREQFAQNDEYVRGLLQRVVSEGIEAGVFADADPRLVARSLMTIVDGARTRFVVFEADDALGDARRTAEEYVTAVLDPR